MWAGGGDGRKQEIQVPLLQQIPHGRGDPEQLVQHAHDQVLEGVALDKLHLRLVGLGDHCWRGEESGREGEESGGGGGEGVAPSAGVVILQ